MITNWKTTAAGVAAILAALADVAGQIGAGHPTGLWVGTDFSAVLTGIGLIFAKDHNVTGAPPTAVSH